MTETTGPERWKAARALLRDIDSLLDSADVSVWKDGSNAFDHFAGLVRSIEAEARAVALQAVRERVEALPITDFWDGPKRTTFVDVYAVLAALTEGARDGE